MQDRYKKTNDYIVELHLLHENETQRSNAIEYFCDMADEIMSFQTEAAAYTHAMANKYALDVIAERSPIATNLMTGSPVRTTLLKFKILRREITYVCASEDYWDEVDRETFLERQVICADA